jgi:ABC-type proline/glycine betaine transport system permease subunit
MPSTLLGAGGAGDLLVQGLRTSVFQTAYRGIIVITVTAVVDVALGVVELLVEPSSSG